MPFGFNLLDIAPGNLLAVELVPSYQFFTPMLSLLKSVAPPLGVISDQFSPIFLISVISLIPRGF